MSGPGKIELTFKQRVLHVVAGIPRGTILTYQQVATRAGSPKAYRAAGSVLKQNFDPAIPCHRVIKSDGSLGNYNRGPALKRKKLRAEGYRPSTTQGPT